MNRLKKYIFALITLLILPVAAWAADYIKIMGHTYTSDNMTTDEVTVTPNIGTLSSGTIKYNKTTHTVTLDGVNATITSNTEFISNFRTDMTLTVIVNSACTITGWYIIDLDEEGSPQSHHTNLIFKSGKADNKPVDLNITTTNADVIIGYGTLNCKLINLNLNVTTPTADRGLFYFKGNGYSPTVELYNCYINVGQLFHTLNGPNLTFTCRGMKWLSGDNQGTPFVFKREINRTTSTRIGITTSGERNMTLTESAGTSAVTSSITPLSGLEFTYGESTMSPSSITVNNRAGGYDCSILITADDIYDFLPYTEVGGPYVGHLTETRHDIVTEDPIEFSYSINPKSIYNSADITVTSIPTQIYDLTNAVQPAVSVYDNGKLMVKGVDYYVSYGGNNSEGTSAGFINIVGMGNYAGSKRIYFAIVNEYFTVGSIDYHATSSTTVSVGNKAHTAAISTALTGIVIPPTITHVVSSPFQVTGVENGAFKDCTALRYVDLSAVTGYTPSSLERTVTASPFYGVPKQALVYLNGKSIKGENYVYNVGTDDYRCEVFKVYDDISGSQTGFAGNDYQWSFENIYPFTAKSIVNTRKMKAGQHYTICLPYDLPIPADTKAYTINGANTAKSLIGFKEVTGTLTKFTPYVLIPSEAGQPLSVTNAAVTKFPEAYVATQLGEVETGNFKMYGTMRYISGAEANGLYIMQGKDANGVCTWKQIQDDNGSYTDAAHKYCVLPMRAYIKTTGSGARPYMSASFTDQNGSTTAINEMILDEEDTDIYDLSGRLISNPSKAGLYIRNGKKVIVR